MRSADHILNQGNVILGAHRGDNTNFPENTMLAFQAAAAVGADSVETDVRMTKDGHLVLIHDKDVERTTNGKGLVADMTLEELRSLDAGSWKGPEFAGVKIPRIEELLELIQGTNMFVNWELKQYPLRMGEERAYGCIDKLVALLDRYGLIERSVMNSFSDCCLEYVDTKWPHTFSILGYPHYTLPKDTPSKPLETFIDWAGIWNRDSEHPAGYEEDHDFAKANNLATSILLVHNTEENYRKALDFGCTKFYSDDPGTAIAILKKLGAR